MILKTRNTLDINVPKTFLATSLASGTNVLAWTNPTGFQASWAIQIGKTGEEQTEVVLLSTSAPSGTLGTLTANTLYAHPTDTPVYAIKYDQVVFESSSSGTAGTATPITNGTITYQADNTFTQFDYTSGVTTDAYRSRYRNSVSGSTTTQSDWITPTGFSFFSLASLRKRIRDKLWNSQYLEDDAVVDNWINEWKDEMSNEAISVNQDYAEGTVDIGFGTNGLGTITTDDFTQPRRVEVTYDGVTYYLSTKMDTWEYLPSQTYASSSPRHNWLGDTVFQVHPSDTAGTARFTFYRFGTTLVNDTDTLPLSMRGFTKSFIDYGLGQAYLKDGKLNEYDRMMRSALLAKNDFVNKITPRDKSTPQYITITDIVSGEDYYEV